MQLENEAGFREIEGGACAAAGFAANGCHCGLNPDPGKNDLGVLYSERTCNVAAVFTTNKVQAAPVLVTKSHLKQTGGKAKAVIANSKYANACTADGEEIAEKMCELAAQSLGILPQETLVASTGVIGQRLPIQPIEAHIDRLTADLSAKNHEKLVQDFMNTDTRQKEAAVEFELNGKKCRLGGMAKGSGMIHPNMATTLNFVTTDAAVSVPMLQKALDEVVKVTYNCLSVDGDTSTNDMLCVLANGAAGNEEVTAEGEAFETFKKALYLTLLKLTKMLAADGEGASKLLECSCKGAPDLDTAIAVAKSVIRSPLVKSAMFGRDANCGRILCAAGYADASFDVHKVDVELASKKGAVLVCKNGLGLEFCEEQAADILSSDEIFINLDLNQGDASAKAWGCDLTYDYVKINADYRS